MIEHHIQRRILHALVKTDTARFTDIRPKNLDTNIVTYHLKQLIKQGYVKKNPDGRYCLTNKGKVIGTTIMMSKEDAFFEAHTVLLMALQNDSGQWLLRKRLAQPMFGWSGFVHGEPIAGQAIADTARQIFKDKTGLDAEFSPRSSGYVTFMDGDTHQSFIHFTLLYANKFSGDLLPKVGNGENYWYSGDFSDEKMLPSMKPLVDALNSDKNHTFFELTY